MDCNYAKYPKRSHASRIFFISSVSTWIGKEYPVKLMHGKGFLPCLLQNCITFKATTKSQFPLLYKRSMHEKRGPTRSVSSSSSCFTSDFGSSSGLKSSISTYHKSTLCYYEKETSITTNIYNCFNEHNGCHQTLTSSIAASCSRDLISSRTICGGADSQPLASCVQQAYY